MVEAEEAKPTKAGGKKKGGGYRFARLNQPSTMFKASIPELADDYFNVGSSSDPSKFTKSIKNIKNYIQKLQITG
jgi:hypothetical protein